MKKVLLIVDYQNDFADPNGALYVKGAEKLLDFINKEIDSGKYDEIWACEDNHPRGHVSFASTHNKNVFDTIETPNGTQVLWPDHCVEGTWGAEFVEGLGIEKFKVILRKGMKKDVDSYSAFFDNAGIETGLGRLFNKNDQIFIVGVAGDYCVKFTAEGAASFINDITLLRNGIAFVNPAIENETYANLKIKKIENIIE